MALTPDCRTKFTLTSLSPDLAQISVQVGYGCLGEGVAEVVG